MPEEAPTTNPEDATGIAALKSVLMNEKLRHADTELQLEMTRLELQAARQEIADLRRVGEVPSIGGADLESIDEAIAD